MKSTGRFAGTTAALGVLVLILDSKTALFGARQGVELCLQTVIPALFPFFVMSNLLIDGMSGQTFRWLNPLGRLTGIPSGSESILLMGLLGGYPIGAAGIANGVKSGNLRPEDGARMIAFCNNAGPSFIFGIAAGLFPFGWMGWLLWGIQILSALMVGSILPGKSKGQAAAPKVRHSDMPSAVGKSLKAMGSVCGWVILFRVFLAILDRWLSWAISPEAMTIISGVLELTNGCCGLGNVGHTSIRMVLCSAFLSFGGLCVWMQTVSVADGLDMRLYFPGKLLQTVFSILLSLLFQGFLPEPIPDRYSLTLVAALLCPVLLIFLKKPEKSSSIPVKHGV